MDHFKVDWFYWPGKIELIIVKISKYGKTDQGLDLYVFYVIQPAQ